MYAIKRELKLNNKERSLMRGCAGFKRFVYNYCLDLIVASWDFEGIKASDSKRISAIKKVFTSVTMQKPEFAWMKNYGSFGFTMLMYSAIQFIADESTAYRTS